MDRITVSKVDGNGQEFIIACVNCQTDKYGICCGIKIVFENNHKKQKCTISKQSRKYYEELKVIKDEVLAEKECRNWLKEHGYIIDTHLCDEERLIRKEMNTDA